MLLKKRWIRPYAPGYNVNIHNGLERNGFKKDNSWPMPNTRMYRHADGRKVIVSGTGYGMKLLWTYFTNIKMKSGRYDVSGRGLFYLTRKLDKDAAK